MKKFAIILPLLVFQGYCLAQNNNVNVNQNQNTVIINNQSVIEKVHYVEKYRTVYIEKPQPKRYARKLSAPRCLLGSIWIYVEDLGNFKSLTDAQEIVNHLNNIGACGRNNWRIPTSAELTVMENNADAIGLGDGIYIATSHRNGILRPVSTGPTIQQQKEAREKEAEEKRKIEEETKRKEEEEEEEARNRELASQIASKKAQQEIINSGLGISDGISLIWGSKNVGASSIYEKGKVFNSYHAPGKWRLPSYSDFLNFSKKASMIQKPYNGVLRKIYTYRNIVLIGGRYLTNDGYYDLGTSDGLSGTQGYVRLVQDIE